MLIDQDHGEQQKQKSVYIYEEQYGKQSSTKTQDDGTQIWYSQTIQHHSSQSGGVCRT